MLTKLNADSYGGGSPTVWRVDPVTLHVQRWRTENLGIEVPLARRWWDCPRYSRSTLSRAWTVTLCTSST